MTLLAALDQLCEAARYEQKQRALAPGERWMRGLLRTLWRRQRDAMLVVFAGLRGEFREALDPSRWEPAWLQAELASLRVYDRPLAQIAEEALRLGMMHSLADLDMQIDFGLSNPRAVAFMRDYGAELVSELNATTRDELRMLLTRAVQDGWSYSRTGRAIRDLFSGFSRQRAELVATHENARAYEAGNRMAGDAIEAHGIRLEHSLLTAGDSRVDGTCSADAGAGWLPFGVAFPSGQMSAPIHVACRCATLTRRAAP